MIPLYTLLLIIFLEGYVVLSAELLAIRMLVPYVGSGTDTVSIIIAAVLMPLAFGYSAGGRFMAQRRAGKRAHTVRKQLLWNLTVSAIFLTIGLSYLLIGKGFDALYALTGINDRIIFTLAYSAVFLVYPVFLLGQTVPLVSQFFRRQHVSRFAGKILFFSTMGSFAGSVFCTLVLMAFLGVHHAVSVTIGCMMVIAFLLAKKRTDPAPFIITFCFFVSLVINSDAAMKTLDIVKNDQYSVVQIKEYDDGQIRALLVNNSPASMIYSYSKDPYAGYVYYIHQNFIQTMLDEENAEPKDILILGAGGFTIGRTDEFNHYTYVDINKNLEEISEKDFLKEELGPNKTFEPLPARGFLNQTEKKYDLVVVDLFFDPTSTPDHLITREFFQQVKDHTKKGGVVVGNFFGSPTFTDPLTRSVDATLRSVFPYLNRQIISDYNGWDRTGKWDNLVYSAVNLSEPATIYTDNKNTALYDRPSKLPPRAPEKIEQ